MGGDLRAGPPVAIARHASGAGARALGLGPDDRLLDVGCADRLEARVLDSILRRLQPSHIGFYRSTELAGYLYGAGLGSARVRRLLGGGYVLVRAERT